MDGVNDLVTDEYRDKVPMKPGADILLERLAALGVPCGIATASEEQSAASEEINRGIMQVDSMAKQNLDAMNQDKETMRRRINELNDEIRWLKRMDEKLSNVLEV